MLQMYNNTAPVTPCDNGSYCCGNKTQSFKCCNEHLGFYLLDEQIVNHDSIDFCAFFSSETSSTTYVTISFSFMFLFSSKALFSLFISVITSILENSNSTSASLSAPHFKIGIIVGGTIDDVIALGLILMIEMCFIRRRRKHLNLQNAIIAETRSSNQKILNKFKVPAFDGSNKLNSTRPLLELGTAQMCQELQWANLANSCLFLTIVIMYKSAWRRH